MLFTARAGAAVSVHPRFVFLDEKTRSAKLFILNQDKEKTFNYRVGLRAQEQLPGGGIKMLGEEAGILKKHLKFSPRYVRELGAGKQQTVKLAMSDFASLPAGDHSIYLLISGTEPVQELAPAHTAGPGITIKLRVIPEIALPVIVRKGRVNDAPKFTNARLEDGKVLFRLQRAESDLPKGLLRGDISVWRGKEMLAIIKARYLLPENDYMDLNLALKEAAPNLKDKEHKEPLRLIFTKPTTAKEADLKNVLCEESVTL